MADEVMFLLSYYFFAYLKKWGILYLCSAIQRDFDHKIRWFLFFKNSVFLVRFYLTNVFSV